MKILMISIFAPHFFNWTEQLKDSGHEVYWLDVFDSGTPVEKIDFVHQIIDWRYKWDFPGRYYLKRKAPNLTKFINKVNERDFKVVLNKKLEEIQPDVVHSFVMYLSTAPIRELMELHSQIKWIYSSWGSDLFYYRKRKKNFLEMQKTLPEIDYMFTDCNRDYSIAVENGFSGEFLGAYPGGGGFDFEKTDDLMTPFSERHIILIKGYQGLHGRCIPVLKALNSMEVELSSYRVVVFGANREVTEFISKGYFEKWKNFELLGKIPQSQVMELMGKSIIYVGNSLSDGIPNTLLEAIIMGVFPIQSNPGGATAELIKDGDNGKLIADPEDTDAIQIILKNVLRGEVDIFSAVRYNLHKIKPDLERKKIKEKVLRQYSYIEQKIRNVGS